MVHVFDSRDDKDLVKYWFKLKKYWNTAVRSATLDCGEPLNFYICEYHFASPKTPIILAYP